MFYSRNMFSNYQSMNKIVQENPEKGLGALWLGDYGAATDKPLLKEKGVKTVLTTASGLGISYQTQDGITHHQYNLLDLPSQNISRFFESTYRDIDEGLQRGSVLVHCAAGISRSATCLIAYLMKKNRTPFQENLNMVRNKRRVVCPNFGFEKQLKQFEAFLGIPPYRAKPLHSKKVSTDSISVLGNSIANAPLSAQDGQQLNKVQLGASSNIKIGNEASLKTSNNTVSSQPSKTILPSRRDTATEEMISAPSGKKVGSISQPREEQKKKIKLEPVVPNQNIKELFYNKLTKSNNENMQSNGIHNKITYPKESKLPLSIQDCHYNNFGPNIVTYSAKGELRTSSRGPVSLNNRISSQSTRTQNFVTMTQFRKRPF